MSYPPIYIINLKRNPERRLYIQRQLDAFNLDYQFVDAVDKHDLLSKEYRTILAHHLDTEEYDFECIYEKLDSNLACSLSHLKIYNLMIENNIERACVLEDDGYLLSSFPEILTRSQEIPLDVLMLSNQTKIVRLILTKIFINSKSQKKLKPFRLCYHFLRLLQKAPINLYMIHLLLPTIIKYITLERNAISKDEKENIARYVEACACEIGALPIIRRVRHRSISHHYITQPYIRRNQYPYYPSSGMAYILTLSAARKWKQRTIAIPIQWVDRIPGELYLEKSIKLYMVTPPCVITSPNYLVLSSRRK